MPLFSEMERDRRWRETRERMAAQGMDALALLPVGASRHDPGCANQQYLSQVGGYRLQTAMVFPRLGDPTVVIPGEGGVVRWGQKIGRAHV